MRSKTTLILAVIAALVGAAIIVSETLGPGDGKRDGQQDARVFKFERDDILMISARGADSSVGLTRAKESRDWVLDKPAGAPADPFVVKCVLDAISEARELTRVGADEAAESGDAGFGLDKPRLVIAVEALGKRVELAIGSDMVVPEKLYARRTGEKEVLVLDKGLLTAFDKPAQNFRDKKIARFEFHKLRAVELSMPSGKCRLERRGNRWRLTSPFEDTCDGAAVANLLIALQEAKAERFEADDVQDAQFPLFGLGSDAPAVGKVVVELDGAAKPIEIVFGNAVLDTPDLILARNSRAPSVFAVNKSIVPALDQNPMQLRSRELFSYLLTDVWKVEIRNEHPLAEVLRRPIIGWQPVLPANYQFDPRRVDFFLMRLAEFKAEAIASEGTEGTADLDQFGLLAPDYRLVLSLEEEVYPEQEGGGERRDLPKIAKREETLLVGVVQGPPKKVFGMIQGRPRIVLLPPLLEEVIAKGHLNFMSLTVNEIFGSDIECIEFLAGDKMLRVACNENLTWHVAESKNLTAEPKGFAEAANAFRDLKALDVAAPHVSMPSPYGFEKPILTAVATLRTDPPGAERKTRKLVVGAKTAHGAYPAFIEGADAVVYLLDKTPVEAMTAPLK